MLAILTAFAAGYWLCQHVGMYRTEQGTDNLEIRTPAIAADIAWLWAALIALCAWSINAGRTVRRFVDTVALPWFAAFGLNVPALPSLPALPVSTRLTA
jgi:hypothetical protein